MKDLEEYRKINLAVREDGTWSGVSRCLSKKDIDSEKVFIASNFGEDGTMDYWAIITHDKKVYEFYYYWSPDKTCTEGEITEWHDYTNSPEKIYMYEEVKFILDNFDSIVL